MLHGLVSGLGHTVRKDHFDLADDSSLSSPFIHLMPLSPLESTCDGVHGIAERRSAVDREAFLP